MRSYFPFQGTWWHVVQMRANQMACAGRNVVAIHDAADQWTLYVAATGTPYPVRIHGPDFDLHLSRYNNHFPVAVPTGAVPISGVGR